MSLLNLINYFSKNRNDQLLCLLMINWNILCPFYEYSLPYYINTYNNHTILYISIYYNAYMYASNKLQQLLNNINIFMGRMLFHEIKYNVALAI